MVAHWRFPKNVSRCPMSGCNAAFKLRSEVLNHYRTAHALNCILCPACEKPILATYNTNVIRHYQTSHGNMEIPAQFNDVIASTSEKDNDEESDMIELKGGGTSTFWRFPAQTTRCPFRNCSVDLGFHSRAIQHYRKKHANDMFYCNLCDRPLSIKAYKTYAAHFKYVHPGAELPAHFKTPEDEVLSIELSIVLLNISATFEYSNLKIPD